MSFEPVASMNECKGDHSRQTVEYTQYRHRTKAAERLRLLNRYNIIHFLEDWVKEQTEIVNADDIPFRFKNSIFFSMYQAWCTKENVSMDLTSISFGLRILQVTKQELNTDGLKCLQKDTSKENHFLYLYELRRYFEKPNRFSFADVMHICRHASQETPVIRRICKTIVARNPWELEVNRLHKICRNDCRIFNQPIKGRRIWNNTKSPKLGITKDGTDTLFGVTRHDPSSYQAKFDYVILPRNPLVLISASNIVIVNAETRVKLLSCFKKRRVQRYMKIAEECSILF